MIANEFGIPKERSFLAKVGGIYFSAFSFLNFLLILVDCVYFIGDFCEKSFRQLFWPKGGTLILIYDLL
jgi:hypothetical protein